MSKLTFLLLPIIVEVGAESAPAATSIEDAVLDLFWDRCASGHAALNLEIVARLTLYAISASAHYWDTIGAHPTVKKAAEDRVVENSHFVSHMCLVKVQPYGDF
jgi:hypothetical protein